ncbi:GNAT family N-acetyltransferase [Legionella maioricensis]|uniref:GNAT family N-acetyltransferase n=1 Tax=Legionella maioricensis TaxID=2896528 RepID=A0A9X2D0Z5_9GAMM|nr:GNAT family N-acetyltransferase [Legionella maioricensis]MCL9683862.1 GNAT family N-acetyltransferase [Legionella maioricensis]MCL9686709.1 GNAT family N-acetyltransferase [Legionella maioricensis]
MLPIIETKRLILRTPTLGDERPLNQAINESLPELQRWMPWASDPSLEPTIQFVRAGIESWRDEDQRDFPLVVVHKEYQEIIGACGYNYRSNPMVPLYEIGYWLMTKYTGLGLATEMVTALARFAFETLHAARVQIVTQVENIRSRRVAEKCGFEIESRLHHYCIDCVTKKPADDLMFVCFDPHQLIYKEPLGAE